MSDLEFHTFHPDLDAAQAVMIDGHAPGYRMISHWPGHETPAPLRHDLTTGSAFLYAELSNAERREHMGEFSVITNNHYDTDGVLSLFTMLDPETASQHKDLILRTARSGDFAVWGGADALALELSIMSDLDEFMPFSTPPFDEERLGNLASAYRRIFQRLPNLLRDPYAMRDRWERRYRKVCEDVQRIDTGQGVAVTRFPDEDLAVVETDQPITIFGARRAAGDLFRVLLVHPGDAGNRYRFCYRGESWWDVVSVQPQPRLPLEPIALKLDELEQNESASWWATPIDWTVAELGFGDPVTFHLQGARFDPRTADDPPSALPTEVVVDTLRTAFTEQPASTDTS